MCDDIVAHTTAVVDGFLVWATVEGDPGVIRLLIDVELGFSHHLIENLLEGTVRSWRRLKANVVSGVSPSPCLLTLKLCAIQLSILRYLPSLRDVFCCADGPLLTHVSDVRGRWLRVAISVNVVYRVLFDEFSKPTVRVNPGVCHRRRLEPLEWPIPRINKEYVPTCEI